jgi:hypothetical protein
LRSEETRFALAVLVLVICVRLGLDLVLPPADPFSVVSESAE